MDKDDVIEQATKVLADVLRRDPRRALHDEWDLRATAADIIGRVRRGETVSSDEIGMPFDFDTWKTPLLAMDDRRSH